jgi:hypothetical protein
MRQPYHVLRRSRPANRAGCRPDPSPCGGWETLEARRLCSTTTNWSGTTISDLPAVPYAVQVQIGDDGYPGGVPGVISLVSGTQTAWNPVAWDADLSDGFDSDWVGVNVDLKAAGPSAAFDVDLGEAAAETSAATSSAAAISRVTLRAAVTGPEMSFAWDSVEVSFYRAGQLVDRVQLGSVTANTVGEASDYAAEAGVTVTTNVTGCDEVVVSGAVRMTASAGTYPGPYDMFGDVRIG